MSKLEELINQLCPDGVEYVKLETISNYVSSGKNKVKSDFGEFPVFGSTGIIAYCDKYEYDIEQILVARVGANAGFVYKSYGKYDVSDNTLMIAPKETISLQYLYYVLSKMNLNRFAKGGGQPLITGKQLKDLDIPLPPLPVQEEIARILDNMTSLTAELTAELKARQKQYEYYRDSLLSFDEGNTQDGVRWKYLNQISINCDRQRKPVTKGNRVAGEYPYYGASGIVDYVSDYIFDGDYLLVSEDGANLLARSTPIAFSISGKSWVNNHAHVLKFDTYELRRFVEIYLNSIDLSKYISGGAQPKLNQENLNKIPIPVPTVEQTKRIVDILDRFDKLCNDISEGLPAEIKARKKQYEYYRDELLTFKEVHPQN